MPQASPVLVSVIILNYNGQKWLARCFDSLKKQTIFSQLEIIIADNQSTDGSDQLCEEWIKTIPRGRFVPNGANLGYCEGNNRGAKHATGQYLFFLNNDTWLEPDCLEILVRETQRVGAQSATPLVLNYEDDSFQSLGSPGIDLFGLSGTMKPQRETVPIFAACGCSLLVDRQLFEKVGKFDVEFFMYADEVDLAWRLWIAGGQALAVPAARLHHRTPPSGPGFSSPDAAARKFGEFKRYLANRNGLLLIMKNAQHVLLLLVLPYLLLLAAEGIGSLLLIRRWQFVRNAYLKAVWDALVSLGQIRASRRQIRSYRCRGDFQLLPYLQIMPSRWDEWRGLFRGSTPASK